MQRRRIAGPIPGTEVLFRPYADGLAIYLRAPSEIERREHMAAIIAFPDKPTVEQALERRRLLVEKWVIRVEGYDDQAGVAISSPRDFFERGELLAVNHAERRIEELLALGPLEKKDSETLSASLPAATTPSSGTAAPAVSLGSVNGADVTVPGVVPDFGTSTQGQA